MLVSHLLSDSSFPNDFACQAVAKEDRATPFVTVGPSHGRKYETGCRASELWPRDRGVAAKLATVKNGHRVTFFSAVVNLNRHSTNL